MSLTFFVVLIIIILLAAVGIVLINKYNEIAKTYIKINDAEINIDETLREKYDLITKVINIIEKNTDVESKVLDEIKNIKSDKYSNFEIDRLLTKCFKEIIKIASDYDSVSKNKSFKSMKEKLKDTEEKLIALRTFYNKYTTKYNLLLSTFPSNIVAKVGKYEQTSQYDGKNLTDENIKDFKI